MPYIEKMIVHNLNLGHDTPKYSGNLIDLHKLERENEALDFFRKHIRNNRSQSSTKECKFNLQLSNQIKNSIIDLVENSDSDSFDEYFIEKSKQVTEHLADSMRNKSRSDGSVFILLYKFNDEKYLGILKMDPNLGIQVNDDLSLIVRDQMLPSTKEKLHKTAFIKYKKEFFEDETHLFVLDRQQSKDEPAKYFMQDFLNATEKANNNNLTEVFEREIKKEVNQYITSHKDKSTFNYKLKKKLSSDKIFNIDEDLPVLTRGVIPDGFALDESIENIKKVVMDKYPDATFSFVPNPEKVKDLEFRSDDQRVIIKINGNLSEEMFEHNIEENTGKTVFKFSPALNIDVWS